MPFYCMSGRRQPSGNCGTLFTIGSTDCEKRLGPEWIRDGRTSWCGWPFLEEHNCKHYRYLGSVNECCLKDKTSKTAPGKEPLSCDPKHSLGVDDVSVCRDTMVRWCGTGDRLVSDATCVDFCAKEMTIEGRSTCDALKKSYCIDRIATGHTKHMKDHRTGLLKISRLIRRMFFEENASIALKLRDVSPEDRSAVDTLRVEELVERIKRVDRVIASLEEEAVHAYDDLERNLGTLLDTFYEIPGLDHHLLASSSPDTPGIEKGRSAVSSVPYKDKDVVVELIEQLQKALKGVPRPRSGGGRSGLNATIKLSKELSVSVGQPFVLALDLLTLQSALRGLNTNEGVDTGELAESIVDDLVRATTRRDRSLDSYKRKVVTLFDKVGIFLPGVEPGSVDEASEVSDIASLSVTLYQNYRDATDGLDAMDRCRCVVNAQSTVVKDLKERLHPDIAGNYPCWYGPCLDTGSHLTLKLYRTRRLCNSVACVISDVSIQLQGNATADDIELSNDCTGDFANSTGSETTEPSTPAEEPPFDPSRLWVGTITLFGYRVRKSHIYALCIFTLGWILAMCFAVARHS